LIIGILQHNLKTRAFCAHSDHIAAGTLKDRPCRNSHPYQNRRPAERGGARQRPGHRNLSLADAVRNARNLRVLDAPRVLSKYDIDGRTFLNGLKTILP